MPCRRSLLPPGWWLIVPLSLGGLSCSKSSESLNPVEGKVLFNKQPLSGALVTLHPKGKTDMTTIPSVGLTREDGTFTVTTGEKTGAPAGEYVVTIICSEEVKSKPGVISTGPVETQDRLQGAYADWATSKITVEIKKGANQLEPFDLK
ncbi:MAG TPA: hypothetical protein VKE40_07185 [Gemmataceae bacterium]|nr:hypothetical protein [Gemmataceae bacterium]